MSSIPDEVDRNYAAFEKELPSLLQVRPGKFALMHREKIVDFHDTAKIAVTQGMLKFGAGSYSVQEVTTQPDDLGFYSYAGGALQA